MTGPATNPPTRDRQRGITRTITHPATGEVLSQADVEGRLVALSDALEDATHAYAEARRAHAEAHSDYRLGYYERLLNMPPGGTVAEREARAKYRVRDLYRLAQIAEAAADAAKDYTIALRTRIEAERTLVTSLREQT